MEKIKLTREQVVFLSFMGIVGNMVYIHTWIDNSVDRAAWVASFIGILLIIPFAIWLFYLGKSYPEGTIFDILERGLGKFVSIPILIVFALINIAVAITHLNMFTEMINVFFLKYTPPWAIMLFITIVCVTLAFGEIKSFSRLVEVLALLGSANYFTTFMFVYPDFFHTEYILPVFDSTWLDFTWGTLFMAFSACECLLLLMVIIRYIPNPDKHYSWVVTGIVLPAVIFAFAIFIIIAIMGSELAKRIAFGGVNAAKLIQIGEFIQGLEVFIFGTYQFIAIGKVTMCIYCVWTSFKKILNNKIPKLLLLISALMIFLPSAWLSCYNEAYFFAVLLASYVLFPFCFLTLILASLSVKVKKKKAASRNPLRTQNSEHSSSS